MRISAEQLELVSEAPAAAVVYFPRLDESHVERLDDATVQLALKSGGAVVLLGHEEAACLRIAAREQLPGAALELELERAARLAGDRVVRDDAGPA